MSSPAAIPQPYEDTATADDLLRLAKEYQKAAHHLRQRRKGGPLTWAPYRLSAIHAIELFLSALLIHKGHDASEVRGMQHDLRKRFELVQHHGLQLRKRTADHLSAMVDNREYLVTRYAPEMIETVSPIARLSPISRLDATLEELANKVTDIMANNGKSRAA